MKFDNKIFIEQLQKQFKDELSPEEVTNLLDLEDTYNKDSPISSGKSLQIVNLK